MPSTRVRKNVLGNFNVIPNNRMLGGYNMTPSPHLYPSEMSSIYIVVRRCLCNSTNEN